MLEVNEMEPLILIVAAGEGKRLRPETEAVPKSFVHIGNGKKLIDLVMEPLPESIERAVLLRRGKKFRILEDHLRRNYGFDNRHILYQDFLTSSLPRSITKDFLLILGYLVGHFPPMLSRNSRLLQQYDPIVLVPADVIVKDLDYLDLIKYHKEHKADVTMPMSHVFFRGSNTRIYTIEDGRFVRATPYIHSLDIELAENEHVYTHEGTYILSRRFFDLPWYKLLRKDYRAPDFVGAFNSLKFVPYEGDFDWIDVRDHQNLTDARRRFG